MKKLKLHQPWLSEVLPSGLSYPSSTLISGPGGSGKPLIGFAFVYDWLKAGGNVIFIPLQYPKMELVKTPLKRLYDLNIDEYSNMKLYLRIAKIENKEVPSEEIQVPIEKEILEEIKEVAESVRKREIPKLMKI